MPALNLIHARLCHKLGTEVTRHPGHGGAVMTTIRALLVFLFCQYDDYLTLGKNGAIKRLLAKGVL